MASKIARLIVGLMILAAGVFILMFLVSTKPKAKKSEAINHGVAVEITTIGKSSSRVIVRARGTVKPAREVMLGTQVGGKVINVSPELQPGGVFTKGEILLRVDPVDYRIAVEQSNALVDSAQAQLSIEESRRTVAKREWEMFGGKGNEELALRNPQMRSATTRLKSARSGLKRARLGVERTLLRAPFQGMIQMRSVDLGQIVGPGAGLIRYVGTRSYWIQVSIAVERLSWITIPGVNGEVGSAVNVIHQVGKERIEKEGRILRLLSEVDPAGRMARILIEVNDPLGLEPKEVAEETAVSIHAKLPLLLGSYVEVEIAGRETEGIIELDRSALRSGNMVYVLRPDSTLEKRKIEMLWRQKNTVLISSGLKTGEQIVISPLSSAVEGMLLRVPGQKNKQPDAPLEEKVNKAAALELPATATKATAL